MKKIIVYEKDFSSRSKIVSSLKETGLEVVGCYSYDKLIFFKSKAKVEDSLEVFIDANDSDLAKAKSEFSSIVTFRKEEIDSDLVKYKLKLESLALLGEASGPYDLICIGGSTGGFPVLQSILKGIKNKNTITIICQHVSKEHTLSLLESLSKQVKGQLSCVKQSTQLRKGGIYMLSGESDFEIKVKYKKIYLEPVGLTEENFHPSFNTLTGSLLKLNGYRSSCIILSGLGNDGSKFLNKLKENNVKILVQAPDSAVAPFMPKAAISTGSVDHIYTEDELLNFIKRSAA